MMRYCTVRLLTRNSLIAIMLGRLEMSVEDCISAYNKMMACVFEEGFIRNAPFTLSGKLKPRFDSEKLKDAIERVIREAGMDPNERFRDGKKDGCKVYVLRKPNHSICLLMVVQVRLRSEQRAARLRSPAKLCQS